MDISYHWPLIVEEIFTKIPNYSIKKCGEPFLLWLCAMPYAFLFHERQAQPGDVGNDG